MRGLVTWAVLVGVLLVSAPHTASAASGFELTRLAGEDRFDTAAAIATDAFPDGAADVVVATGLDYPDALAGSFLAGQLSAPLLLVATDAVPQSTVDALAALKAERVTILGGPGVVSDGVEATLADLDSTSSAGGKIQVDRVAGTTRYGTARAVATAVGTAAGTVAGKVTAIIGRGDAFPDTLAAGPLAYAAGLPILLTPTNLLHADTKAALEDLGVEHAIILGGSAAISDQTESAIQDARGAGSITTERLAGTNRQETARLIAEYAVDTLGFSDELVTLARGDKFPDALAGAPHGGEAMAPTLLTVLPTKLSPTSASGATRYLNDHSATLTSGAVLGGSDAVSDAVVLQAEAAATGSDTTPPEIVSAVANATAETVVLTYSELVECAAAAQQFTFTGAATTTPESVTCGGARVVTLRFDDVSGAGDVIYVDDQTAPDANDIADLAGNTADDQSIAATLAANSTPPVLESAVANVSTDTVTATFSEDVSCVDASKGQFHFQGSTATSISCTGDSPVATLGFGQVSSVGGTTLTYTDDDPTGSDANDVQDTAGNPADDSSVEVTFTGDATAPTFVSAVTSTGGGAQLTVTYSENVACTDTQATLDQFSFGPTSATPTSIGCFGNRARLDFDLVLSEGELTYDDDDPATLDANDVHDAAGNPAVDGDSVTATTNEDTAGPAVSSVGVNEATDLIGVTYDEPVFCGQETLPQFTYGGVVPDAIDCPSSDGNRSNRVWLYFGDDITAGQDLQYLDDDPDPDVNDVMDAIGNPAADHTETVDSTVSDTTAPTITDVGIDPDADVVTVTYSTDVTCDDTAAARAQFSFDGATAATPTELICAVDSSTSNRQDTIDLVFDDVTGPGDLAYSDDDPAADGNDIRDWNGNSAADQSYDASPPTISNAAIGADDTTMTLTYSEPVSCGPVGDRKAHFSYEGTQPKSVACDGTATVTLTFDSAVTPGGTLTYDDLDNGDSYYVRDESDQANPAPDQDVAVSS